MIEEKTVGQIVADDIRTATVFRKHGLDFCCGGGKKLKTACAENGADLEKLTSDLELIIDHSESAKNYRDMPLEALVDHIYEKHHKYIYDNGQVTAEFINKVARVHGERHPETIEIAKLYSELILDLHQHMMKEERILFPYIKQLISQSGQPRSFINGPITVMQMEHDSAGVILKKMSALSDGYTPPMDACNTYRAAYANLKALEEDIHLHIHLENNILFPKAIALEQELLG